MFVTIIYYDPMNRLNITELIKTQKVDIKRLDDNFNEVLINEMRYVTCYSIKVED